MICDAGRNRLTSSQSSVHLELVVLQNIKLQDGGKELRVSLKKNL